MHLNLPAEIALIAYGIAMIIGLHLGTRRICIRCQKNRSGRIVRDTVKGGPICYQCDLKERGDLQNGMENDG
jgi:hypothetical protein